MIFAKKELRLCIDYSPMINQALTKHQVNIMKASKRRSTQMIRTRVNHNKKTLDTKDVDRLEKLPYPYAVYDSAVKWRHKGRLERINLSEY